MTFKCFPFNMTSLSSHAKQALNCSWLLRIGSHHFECVAMNACLNGHWRDSHGNVYAVSEGDHGFDIQTTYHLRRRHVQYTRGLVMEGTCGRLLWGKTHYLVWDDADTVTWWPWSTKKRKWFWRRLNENDPDFLYKKNAMPVPPDEPPPLTAHEGERVYF